MSNRNIVALNAVAQNLIEMREGYSLGASLVSPDNDRSSPELSQRFQRRAAERQRLIEDIQAQIRHYGEHPIQDGIESDVQKDFEVFSRLFEKDEAAALSAIDKGETDLADTITELLRNYSRLSQSTKRLLRQAYKDAKSRQRLSGLH